MPSYRTRSDLVNCDSSRHRWVRAVPRLIPMSVYASGHTRKPSTREGFDYVRLRQPLHDDFCSKCGIVRMNLPQKTGGLTTGTYHDCNRSLHSHAWSRPPHNKPNRPLQTWRRVGLGEPLPDDRCRKCGKTRETVEMEHANKKC
jgi:hypothetical protein